LELGERTLEKGWLRTYHDAKHHEISTCFIYIAHLPEIYVKFFFLLIYENGRLYPLTYVQKL